MNSLPGYLREVSERRIFQVAILYVGVAWGLAQGVDFAVDNYDLSRKVLDISVLVLALGFPAALTIAWYHGERGDQRIQRSEIAILLVLVVLAGIGTFRIGTAEAERASAAPGFVDLGESSVAVLPFHNRISDPELDWLDRGLAELVGTDLAQLRAIRVVSGRRLFDLLRQEGREELRTIPAGLESDLARNAGARYMVTGSVLGDGESLAITANLVDLESGEIVAASRVQGTDVFALVDELTGRLADRIVGTEAEPAAVAREMRPIAEVTTSDLEAYREYQAGLDAQRRFHYPQARDHLENAVAIDPGFALAHLRLTLVLFSLGDFAPAFEHFELARTHLSAASERDRMFIEGLSALMTGRPDEAREKLRELVRRYPDDKEARIFLSRAAPEDRGQLLEEILQLDPFYAPAYNSLAYVHAKAGRYEIADSLIDRYVALQPTEPNPRDSQGEIRELAGRYEAARESYREALRLDPEFGYALDHLVRSYLRENRPGDARRELAELRPALGPDLRVRALLLEASTRAWEGLAQAALDGYRTAAGAALADSLPGLRGRALGSLLTLQNFMGLHEDALRTAGTLRAADPRNSASLMGTLVALGEQGRLDEMLTLRDDILSETMGDPTLREFLTVVRAVVNSVVAYYEGDYEQSLALLETAAPERAFRYLPFELAALARTGKGDVLLERIGSMRTFVWSQTPGGGGLEPLAAHLVLYYEGRAHELRGERPEAIQAYTELIDRVGEDGARALEPLSDAPDRLARLRAEASSEAEISSESAQR